MQQLYTIKSRTFDFYWPAGKVSEMTEAGFTQPLMIDLLPFKFKAHAFVIYLDRRRLLVELDLRELELAIMVESGLGDNSLTLLCIVNLKVSLFVYDCKTQAKLTDSLAFI